MSNSEQNQNVDLAAQHKYAREKEAADKVLARYDFMMKATLAFLGTFFGIPVLIVLAINFFIGIILAAVCGGIIFLVYKSIKTRKDAHQAKLDNEIMNNQKREYKIN